MFKKLIISAFTIVFMLIVVALILPFLVPVSEYQDGLLKLAKDKLGREITVEGDLQLTLLPSISLQADGVTVANAKGFSAPYLAKLTSLKLNVELWPLLEKRLIVKELSVIDPIIHLEKNASGKANWEFELAEKKTSTSSASTTASNAKSQGTKTDSTTGANNSKEAAPTKNMQYDIGLVTVENAVLNYREPAKVIKVDGVDASFTPQELVLSANAYLDALPPLAVKLNADTPSGLWEGADLPIKLSVKAKHLDLAMKGLVKGVNIEKSQFDGRYEGALSIKSDSVAGLQKQFTGSASAPAKALTLESGSSVIDAKKIALNSLEVAFAGSRATGELTTYYTEKTPRISGDIVIPSLDLNKLQMADNSVSVNTETFAQAISTVLSSVVASAHAAGSDAGKDAGWSKDKIDLSGLKAANANLSLAIGNLKTAKVSLNNLLAKIKLKNGVLDLTIPPLNYGGGKLSVKAHVNAAKKTPTWRKELSLVNVDFQSLTENVMDKSQLEGKTNGDVFFAGAGSSLHSWMQNLSGGGKLNIRDAIVKGYSLEKLFRQLRTAAVPTFSAGESTKLQSISANFTVDNGVMKLKQAALKSPQLQATATGDISLKGKSLNLYLRPKIAPKVDAEGKGASLLVPLRVKGGFDNISVRPDFNAAISEVLSNPNSAKEAATVIREEGRALRKDFKEKKKSLKENWKNLKDNKDPAALNNLLDTLGGAASPLKGFGF